MAVARGGAGSGSSTTSTFWSRLDRAVNGVDEELRDARGTAPAPRTGGAVGADACTDVVATSGGPVADAGAGAGAAARNDDGDDAELHATPSDRQVVVLPFSNVSASTTQSLAYLPLPTTQAVRSAVLGSAGADSLEKFGAGESSAESSAVGSDPFRGQFASQVPADDASQAGVADEAAVDPDRPILLAPPLQARLTAARRAAQRGIVDGRSLWSLHGVRGEPLFLRTNWCLGALEAVDGLSEASPGMKAMCRAAAATFARLAAAQKAVGDGMTGEAMALTPGIGPSVAQLLVDAGRLAGSVIVVRGDGGASAATGGAGAGAGKGIEHPGGAGARAPAGPRVSTPHGKPSGAGDVKEPASLARALAAALAGHQPRPSTASP